MTPTQVTALHTLCGLAAAIVVWRGSPRTLLVAAICWELHLLLDCLDGALARARGTASERGRTLDIMGDSLSYVALAAAMAVHVRATHPGVPAALLAVALITSGGLAAWGYDFYLRKFTAALTTGTDPIFGALHAKYRIVRAGRAGFVAWFGYAFEWLQVVWLQWVRVRDLRRRLEDATALGVSPDTIRIVRNAETPAGRRALRVVSLVSSDNNVTIVGLGLLTGQLIAAQVVAIAWASTTLLLGVVASRVLLRDAGASEC